MSQEFHGDESGCEVGKQRTGLMCRRVNGLWIDHGLSWRIVAVRGYAACNMHVPYHNRFGAGPDDAP